MACLCAPTTHEGSFRCRLHRGIPLVSNSAQLAANHLKGGFNSSSKEIADQPWLISTASAPHKSFPSSSPPPPLPYRYSRPPPSKRGISSSTRSTYPGSITSSTPSEALATQCITGPNASHAAALAIMKQHKQSKSHVNRNNIALRSSAVYKIGPSRLSRMGGACADEVPVLKRVDCCILIPSPHNILSPKSSSFHSDEVQARGSTTMETSPVTLKTRSILPKFKQSDSSCKIGGYKAGPLIVSTVY